MIAMLIAAIGLASIVPATGPYQGIAQSASNAAIFALFFLNGIRLSRADIAAGMRNLRFLLPLVMWCFGAMSLAGFGLYWVGSGSLPILVALGLLYLGAMPSTVQSATAYTSIARGNIASSVVAVAVINILGVFLAAPIFAWMSGGAFVDLGFTSLTKLFGVLILPFALGQILQARLKDWLAARKTLIGWMDRTAIAIAVYVAFSGAVAQGVWTKLDGRSWLILLALLTAFLLFAFIGAWLLTKMLRLNYGDRIAFTFAGAQKSVAMGAPLALILFPAEEAGLILVPLLIYHLLQLIISAPLANRFREAR